MRSIDREPVRLLADCMLGRLSKWLRILGLDTAYEKEASDPALARRARAEGRILLTRDRELASRRGLETIYIESEALPEQLRQIQSQLGLPSGESLSRCPICNRVLRPETREQVVGDVSPYVLATQKSFRRCPECRRVYWPGTHIELMEKHLRDADLDLSVDSNARG